MNTDQRRLIVIGLDSAVPDLVFNTWRQDLPNIDYLINNGAFGPLKSCDPPITIPAWTSMLSSRDPGQLGFCGFRNRSDYSYKNLMVANASVIKAPRVWDILNEHDKKCILVGIPQTYPLRPLNGCQVSDSLTPRDAKQWTYPDSLADEIRDILGGNNYEFDVPIYRTNEKKDLLESLYRVSQKRWQVVHHLLEHKPWDFFMTVEMGTDRIHHGFWSFMDMQHHRYSPNSIFEHAIHDFYVHLDTEIGKVLNKVGDETRIIIVSDHGAQRMEGGICLNEWLIQHGYLSLKQKPDGIVSINQCEIDWSRTKAWASGGFFGRIFMNVEGREPQGIISSEDYERERTELQSKLQRISGPNSAKLSNSVLKPQEIYREVNGPLPDLLVYFDELRWRAIGSVGFQDIYTRENDTGPDDANHAQYGLVILYDPRSNLRGNYLTGLQLESIGPTILDWLEVQVPASMMGSPITLPHP